MSRAGPCGTRIDRYVIERLIAAGGMGEVYRARHVTVGQTVAFKLLRAELAQDAQAIERFVREARAAATIGHEHIPRVSDFSVADDGRAFMVMEYLEGRDLEALLEETHVLSVPRAVDIALQVLDALAAAHAVGVVHRDVKPGNVFLVARPAGGPDFVKLLDFGISRMRVAGAASLTRSGMMLGTPVYMAPEQFVSAREAGPTADIYATAVMLYRALSGVLPFDGETLEQLLLNVSTAQPRPLSSAAPSLPRALVAVVERGMARAPDQRWPDAHAFAAALREARPRIDDAMSYGATRAGAQPVANALAYASTAARSVSAPSPTQPAAVDPMSQRGPIAQPAARFDATSVRAYAPAPAQPSYAPPGAPFPPQPPAIAPRRPRTGTVIVLGVTATVAAILVAGLIGAMAVESGRKPAPASPSATSVDASAPGVAFVPPAIPQADPTPAATDPPSSDPVAPPLGSEEMAQAMLQSMLATRPEPERREIERQRPAPAVHRPDTVTVGTPQIAGTMPHDAVQRLLQGARPSLDTCRRVGQGDDVIVQLLFLPGRPVSAMPAPLFNVGNAGVARCVADRLGAALGPVGTSGFGSISVAVALPAR